MEEEDDSSTVGKEARRTEWTALKLQHAPDAPHVSGVRAAALSCQTGPGGLEPLHRDLLGL